MFVEDGSEVSVALAGLGTVGGAVLRRLVDRREKLARRSGCELRLSAVAEPSVPPDLSEVVQGLTHYEDALEMVREEQPDVLVELIGGLEPAGSLLLRALEGGIDVVTANKELLARRGEEIFRTASENGARIRFEASVGGCIPVVRTIREALIDTDFSSIHGIINGTCNYVLTRMTDASESFEESLTLAQAKGYAEADPTYDVKGKDSAHKISLLAALAFGARVTPDEIRCEGITRIRPEIIADADRLGYRIKLLGVAKRVDGQLDVRVHPALIPEDSALAAVRNEYNAVLIQGDPIGSCLLSGKGAGGRPTATAVIADVLSLAGQSSRSRAPVYFNGEDVPLLPSREMVGRFYLRLRAVDRPGVLARITRILGERDISIDSVLQSSRSEGDRVPVILTTHRARRGDVGRAVETISDLDVVEDDPVCLPIEEDFERP